MSKNLQPHVVTYASVQSAALFTVDEVDDKVSVNSGWLMPMHYNKSQQVSQLSTCFRYSFNCERHEHTFCHHFDIETFRGVRAPQPGIEWTSNGKYWFHTGYVDMPCLICSYSNPKTQVWLCQRKLFVSKNNTLQSKPMAKLNLEFETQSWATRTFNLGLSHVLPMQTLCKSKVRSSTKWDNAATSLATPLPSPLLAIHLDRCPQQLLAATPVPW